MESFNVYDILEHIYLDGATRSPRGMEIKEVRYFQGLISSPHSNYVQRGYPVDYFKREMQWYLHADPMDLRITRWAKMWGKLIQPDGSVLSNYGQYWFGWQNGFKWVVDTLRNDPDSRQAYIPMCNYHHTYPGNKDVVCTKGIKFDIVEGHLDVHVAMRSSDAIYGLATDLPCFWTLWEMVACELKVPTGSFIFSADSVHIYEKHFTMVKNILDAGPYDLAPLDVPPVTDAQDLITETYVSDFGKWLLEANL